MLRFYEARDELEAQLLIDYLADAHIEATVLGRYLSGAAGELSAMSFPMVWLVENQDETRAKQLLNEFLQRRQASDAADWVCSHCGTRIEGEFDLCWQCGVARD